MARATDNQIRGNRSRGRDAGVASTLAVAALAVLVFATPTFVVVAVGMLPTVAALIVDRGPGKYAARCVGGLNLAGVAPYVALLWQDGHTLHGALAIVSDVFAWLVMYSAAALGWLLYLGMRPLVATFLEIRARQRVAELRAYQEALVREWGKEVAEPARRR